MLERDLARDEVGQGDGEEGPDGDARVEAAVAAGAEVEEVLHVVEAVEVEEAAAFVFFELRGWLVAERRGNGGGDRHTRILSDLAMTCAMCTP